jgi:hypothetical protein
MCAYKLVTVEFKWFGLQNRVEKFIQNVCLIYFYAYGKCNMILKFLFQSERRLFLKFYRQMFCWMDQWYGLTIEDIRRIEEEVKHELNKVFLKFCN